VSEDGTEYELSNSTQDAIHKDVSEYGVKVIESPKKIVEKEVAPKIEILPDYIVDYGGLKIDILSDVEYGTDGRVKRVRATDSRGDKKVFVGEKAQGVMLSVSQAMQGGAKADVVNEVEIDTEAQFLDDLDAALSASGRDATELRRDLKQKYGADKVDKAVRVSREIEKIIAKQESDGSVTKICP
jgi:hypothetical protein